MNIGGSWMFGAERGSGVGGGIATPHSEAMVASPMLANHSATRAGHASIGWPRCIMPKPWPPLAKVCSSAGISSFLEAR